MEAAYRAVLHKPPTDKAITFGETDVILRTLPQTKAAINRRQKAYDKAPDDMKRDGHFILNMNTAPPPIFIHACSTQGRVDLENNYKYCFKWIPLEPKMQYTNPQSDKQRHTASIIATSLSQWSHERRRRRKFSWPLETLHHQGTSKSAGKRQSYTRNL